MRVSHKCPNCDVYNQVASGTPLDPFELQFTCISCSAIWFRKICDTCLGSGYFMGDPCDCDLGMVPETKPQFWMGIKPSIAKPTFGGKPKPKTVSGYDDQDI